MSTATTIEKLAQTVADKASKTKKLSEQLEALRVLAPYYTALKKQRVGDPTTSDEPEGTSIRAMQDAVHKAENNGKAVSDHQ